MTWTDESDPLDEMKTLITDHWKGYREVEMPAVIVANDASDVRLRADMRVSDIIIVKMDGVEKLTQRYNFTYYDRAFPIIIEIQTKESRQRLRNLGKVVRMIINDNIHSFPSYQLIRYKSYTESVEENLNVWRCIFRLQLESNAVCTESLSD